MIEGITAIDLGLDGGVFEPGMISLLIEPNDGKGLIDEVAYLIRVLVFDHLESDDQVLHLLV